MELHNVDCAEFMPWMDSNGVDLVFTSVPFRNEDVGARDDAEYWEKYCGWHGQMLRVAAKAVVVIQSPTRLNEHIRMFPPKRTLIWGKGVIMPSWRLNPIFVYQRSDAYKVNKYIYSDTFGVDPIKGESFSRCKNPEKIHKYQDPDILYETIIKMFRGCRTVFDPFMGSGTTGCVCAKLGLDFIGCEIDKETYKSAATNLNAARTR